jgi:hypothetical protein
VAGIRLERRVVRIIRGKLGTHGNWKAIVLFLCTPKDIEVDFATVARGILSEGLADSCVS